MKKITGLLLLLVLSTSTFACWNETKKGMDALYSAMDDSIVDSYYNYKKDGVCDRLEDFSKKSFNKLYVEEVLGIYAYTTNDIYKDLNRTLRSGKAADKKKYGPLVKVINKGLDKLPNYKGMVVRFEKKKSVNSWQPGKIKTFKAYTSTSKKKGFCWSGNTKMKIKSKTGKYIGMISAYANEEEVLYAPKKKFKVISLKKAKKGSSPNCNDESTLNVIELEEL